MNTLRRKHSTSNVQLRNSRSEIRNGFTLIELLVVIAIISILMAMLLPALKSARDSAKSSICNGNAKQLVFAALSYTGDFGEYLPSASNGGGEWFEVIASYGASSVQIRTCPSYPAEYRCSGWKSDYGWNYKGWDGNPGTWGLGHFYGGVVGGPVKLTRIGTPSKMLMLGDARDRGDAASRAADQPCGLIGGGAWPDYTPRLHSRGCQIGFVDGHAMWYPWSELVSPSTGKPLWTLQSD